MAKVIGVVGSRRRNEPDDLMKVWEAFENVYEPGDSVCSGLCPKGADAFIAIIADELGLPEDKRIWFPADWKRYGKGAAFIRNTDIAKTSDVLIACMATGSNGTKDTVRQFKQFHPDGELIIV
jgi:hypothetical protein